MPEIKFTVPDGELCLDCPHQEDFSVNEVECTTYGDLFNGTGRRYVRSIAANCHLLNQPIRGTEIGKMHKCAGCMEAGR